MRIYHDGLKSLFIMLSEKEGVGEGVRNQCKTDIWVLPTKCNLKKWTIITGKLFLRFLNCLTCYKCFLEGKSLFPQVVHRPVFQHFLALQVCCILRWPELQSQPGELSSHKPWSGSSPGVSTGCWGLTFPAREQVPVLPLLLRILSMLQQIILKKIMTACTSRI